MSWMRHKVNFSPKLNWFEFKATLIESLSHHSLRAQSAHPLNHSPRDSC